MAFFEIHHHNHNHHLLKLAMQLEWPNSNLFLTYRFVNWRPLLAFAGTGAKGQKSDSHDRLFGELNRQITPTKNHMKSSIPFGDKMKGTNGVAKTNGHSNGGSSSSSSSTNGDAVDMAPVPATRKGENKSFLWF